MRAGQLRERITIQAEEAAVEEGPSRTSGYVDQCTVWARVRPLSSREYFSQGQTRSTARHEVMTRAPLVRSDDQGADEGSEFIPTAAMRIVWNGRTCEVTSAPVMDERGRTWTFRVAVEA